MATKLDIKRRLEKEGWKVVLFQGNSKARATKGSRVVEASSISELRKKLIGY